jgi:DNA-binding IclR family transcriptional regulator
MFSGADDPAVILQSVDRAIRVLFSVAERAEGVGVRELARIHGLTPPTTQNMLQTLLSHGLVRFDPVSRRYRLGVSAVQLGAGHEFLGTLQQMVHLPLVEHARRVGCHCVAVAFHEGEVVILESVTDPDESMRIRYRPQVARSPHVMGAGIAVMALLSPDERRQLYQHLAADEAQVYAVDPVEIEGYLASAVPPDGMVFRPVTPRLENMAWGLPLRGLSINVPMAVGSLITLPQDAPERRRQVVDSLRRCADEIRACMPARTPPQITG